MWPETSNHALWNDVRCRRVKKQTRDQFSHEGEGFAQTIKYPCPFHRLGLKYFFFFFRRKVWIAKTTYLTLEKPLIFVGSLICFFLEGENGKAFIVCECNVGLDPVVFYQLCIPITNIYEIIENHVILSLRNKGFFSPTFAKMLPQKDCLS